MTQEETDIIRKLQEAGSYFRARCTSLEKEIRAKDVEIGTLKGWIQELKDERSLVKGDMKTFRKEMYIQGLLKQLKELKKDNEALICKIGVQHGNKNS